MTVTNVIVTNVIVLAQGNQSRLGMEHGYKQLLPLEGCGGVPILRRTLSMIAALGGFATVIGWPGLFTALNALSPPPYSDVTLSDPGNSSLRGIARYLGPDYYVSSGIAVLLGDVVYSWACLSAILRYAESAGFVGTRDLRADGGELWGVGWDAGNHKQMMAHLHAGLRKHPPVAGTYQPGQLRRWIPGGPVIVRNVSEASRNGMYTAVDDYTMDVDRPKDLERLRLVSALAADDDEEHGLRW